MARRGQFRRSAVHHRCEHHERAHPEHPLRGRAEYGVEDLRPVEQPWHLTGCDAQVGRSTRHASGRRKHLEVVVGQVLDVFRSNRHAVHVHTLRRGPDISQRSDRRETWLRSVMKASRRLSGHRTASPATRTPLTTVRQPACHLTTTRIHYPKRRVETQCDLGVAPDPAPGRCPQSALANSRKPRRVTLEPTVKWWHPSRRQARRTTVSRGRHFLFHRSNKCSAPPKTNKRRRSKTPKYPTARALCA